MKIDAVDKKASQDMAISGKNGNAINNFKK